METIQTTKTMIQHKHKIEYLNLCNIYGNFEITSIFSLKYYSKIRSYTTQKEVIEEIDKLLYI